jgi:hypothetical protein
VGIVAWRAHVAGAQSGASALQLAGARLIAMVLVGRAIKSDVSPEAAGLPERVCKESFDFDVCCVEARLWSRGAGHIGGSHGQQPVLHCISPLLPPVPLVDPAWRAGEARR